MKKEDVCALIKEIAIIPAIRVSSGADAHFAAEAVCRGGIPIVEITMTVPGAVELISHLARHNPNTIVGAGTVLDTETARRCLDAGASSLTAPEFYPDIVQFAAKENVAVLPGALTPTEVAAAWRSGADFVKVFPCSLVGGDKYIKALLAALPFADCGRGCQPADGCELHRIRCNGHRGWHGIDPDRGNHAASAAKNPGIGASFCGVREGRPRACRGDQTQYRR